MNELEIFNNPEFGQIRATEINGEPYFVGKDVCDAFGDTNYRRSLSKYVTKRTCLWLKGLPVLKTNDLPRPNNAELYGRRSDGKPINFAGGDYLKEEEEK